MLPHLGTLGLQWMNLMGLAKLILAGSLALIVA